LGEISVLLSFQNLKQVRPAIISLQSKLLTSGSLSCIVLSVIHHQHWSFKWDSREWKTCSTCWSLCFRGRLNQTTPRRQAHESDNIPGRVQSGHVWRHHCRAQGAPENCVGVSNRVHDILITGVVEEKIRCRWETSLYSYSQTPDVIPAIIWPLRSHADQKKERIALIYLCTATSSLKLVLRCSSKESKKYVWSWQSCFHDVSHK